MSDYPDIRAAKIHALETEAERNVAEAAHYRAMTRDVELDADEKEREDRKARSLWDQHRILRIADSIGSSSVTIAMQRLHQFHVEDPGCEIEIQFTSPGGSVLQGMALFDYIGYLRAQGHRVTTVVSGMAASMAGILIQAGDHRVMGKESWLLIHEVSLSAEGKIGELEDTTKWAEAMCKRVAKIFVERAGGRISMAQFQKGWKRTDWWLDSDDCLRLGFVDEVR